MADSSLQSKPAKRQKIEGEAILGSMVDEILEEILVRLPVKSLLRFKATCKTWRSLIESPFFIDFHSRQHRLDYQNRLLFSRFEDPISHSMFSCSSSDNLELISSPRLYKFTWKPPIRHNKWPLDFAIPDPYEDDDDDDVWNEMSPYFCILGPLNNGVYCTIDNDRQRPKRISVATSLIALSNNATRDYKATNPFPPESAALLSDLARRPSQVHYGFGMVRNESGIVVDYKVVVIVLSGQDYRFVSFVYSLKRGSWDKIADVKRGAQYSNDSDDNKAVVGLVNGEGEIEIPLLIQYDLVGCPQLFLHGSWHWLDIEYDRVLLFDIAEEAFGYIEGPPHDYHNQVSDNDGFLRGGLLLLDDRLAAIYVPHVLDTQYEWCCDRFDVWVMMEYRVRESWTKIYSCKAAFGRLFENVIGLCYSRTTTAADTTTEDDSHHSGKIHIQRVFLDDKRTGQLFSWDGSETTEHSFHLQPSDGLWNTLGISTYVETLESLTLPHN